MVYSDEPEFGSQLGVLLLWLFLVPALFLGYFLASGAPDDTGFLFPLSAAGVVCGAMVLLMIYGASILAGRNRDRLSAIFGPSIRLMMLALAVSVVAQAALFVFGIFNLEAALIGRVHVGILFAISLGAIIAAWTLVAASVRFLKVTPGVVRGAALSKEEAPELWAAVSHAAAKLGSIEPDNIVVGLEPNFYVTHGEIKVVGKGGVVRGNTLYASLPLMRIFTESEFLAVLGHELGHFRGDDLKYSMKFAPTYSRIGHAMHHLGVNDGEGSAADLAKIPALLALGTSLNRFAIAERAISREREIEADKAGASVTSAKDLATALFKLSAFIGYWDHLIGWNIEELNQGKLFTNLPETYASICASEALSKDWTAAKSGLANSEQPHPVDTHPPLSQRLEALGLMLDELPTGGDLNPSVSAIVLLTNAEEIEESLSHLEAQWLEAIGAVSLPPADTAAD